MTTSPDSAPDTPPERNDDRFHRLHLPGRPPLMLVNAWDAASALVLERGGEAAIATTSAGIAWSLGYPDGERLPRAEFVAACARIARVVRAPLSVDIERGYAADLPDLARALLDIGVVGVNVEDGTEPGTRRLRDADAACARIATLRDLAAQRGVRLFVNARTDVYFAASDEPQRRLDEALARARRYVAAGADGIFVPGLDRLDEIAHAAREIDRPLNVYAGYAGVPDSAALAAAGVRRISLGCGPLQAALALLQRIAADAGSGAGLDAMTQRMASVAELNAAFASVAASVTA